MKEAAFFVDGSFVYKVWRATEHGNLDYRALRQLLEEEYLDEDTRITEAYYFNADDDPPKASTNAFHEQLKVRYPNGPGFRLKMYWLAKRKLFWPQAMGGEPVVHPETGEQFVQMTQKGVDVGLALHLLKSFNRRRWSTLFLAAGDGDFSEVIEYLVEEENVDVYLIGAERSVSLELMQFVRGIIDIPEIADRIRFAPLEPSQNDNQRFDATEETEVVVKRVNMDIPYGFVSAPGRPDAIIRSNENPKLVWPPNVGDRLVGRLVEQLDVKKGVMGLKMVHAKLVDPFDTSGK